MPSLRARFVNWILPLRGTKARMSSEERMARHYAGNASVAVPPPRRLRREFRVEETKVSGRTVYRVTPRNGGSGAHILYLHGGTYVNEVLGAHWKLIAGLVRRTGASVTVPLYPLAPKHKWSDAFEMLRPLCRDLIERRGAAHVALMGDCAGAGLSLALARAMRDAGEPLPARLVLLSPWLDLRVDHPEQDVLATRDRMLAAPGLRWAGQCWAAGLPMNDPRVSPLHGALKGLPPIAVFTGTADLLNSDARRLLRKAQSLRFPLLFREYEGLFHLWMAAPVPEAGQALDEVAAFLRGLR